MLQRIFPIFLTVLLSFVLCGLLVHFSFVFGASDTLKKKTTSQITYSLLTVKPQSDGYADLDMREIDIKTEKPKDNSPILLNFGRLGSFLYLASGSTQTGAVLTESGKSDIILGSRPGILSLYDLFLSYKIHDQNGDFRLDQITNGSFYIGKEADGKVAIYAMDGVVRLTFLAQKEEMTSMILFPGTFIRFDPKKNRSLKNADLFRTILSLQDSENEVFEFVNPRVNIGDDKDTLLNYRLPSQTKPLFQALSALFRKKIERIDPKKGYAICRSYSDEPDASSLFINPAKKNHNMLVQLSSLLACAVNAGGNPGDLVKRIADLYNQAKKLQIEEGSAKAVVEQFLLDGRFASYGGIASSRYQEIYESIAKMIGIEPTGGKSRLLQSLADIYSRNLFTQKRTKDRIRIDTYAPTAVELEKTVPRNGLDQTEYLDQKDYFDIAIYAFNILKKTEVKKYFLSNTTLEDNSTYTYLSTFFRASSRYIESIDDAVKKQQTVMSFSKQFYDYILTALSHSLYDNYTIVEDGMLYLSTDLREGTKLKISQEFRNNVDQVNAIIETIIPSIESLWSSSGSNDADTYGRIQDEILRLKGFGEMIDENGYKEYVKSPYKVVDGSGVVLPRIDPDKKILVRAETGAIDKIKNTKIITTDPRILELKKIWPEAQASSWLVEGEYIRVIRAPYGIARKEGTSSIEVSALYKDDALSDIIVFYNGRMIQVAGDSLSVQGYYALISDLRYYLDIVDKYLPEGTVGGDIRIFPLKKRININESIYTVDTSS